MVKVLKDKIKKRKGQLNFFIFAYWHDPNWRKFVGASVKVWDLAENLSSWGHDVTIFLPKYNFDKADIPFRVVEIPFFDLPFLRLITFNIFLLISLLFRFTGTTPDIIYVRRMTSIIPLIYAKLIKAKFFYEVNDDPYPEIKNTKDFKRNNFRSGISAKIDEICLKYCTKGLIISKGVKDKILRFNPLINSNKLYILPSGSNTNLFRPLDQNENLRHLNLDSQKQYVGFIGSLLPHQGIDTLICAALEVLKILPNTVFLIIGEGPMRKEWEKQVVNRSLNKAFMFLGQIEYRKMPNWIAVMDICVAPFKKSAGLRSPVKIFDYMACGKPTVASKIIGTTDIFENEGAIHLIEAENSQALAEGIIKLLNNKKFAAEMGKKGLSLVKANFDRKYLAKNIIGEVWI